MQSLETTTDRMDSPPKDTPHIDEAGNLDSEKLPAEIPTKQPLGKFDQSRLTKPRGDKKSHSSDVEAGEEENNEEEEEEELDEFGRVKRRRHKFTSERKDTEDGEYDGEEDDRRHTRGDYGHDSGSDGEGRPRRYQSSHHSHHSQQQQQHHQQQHHSHHRRRRSSSPRRRYTPRSRHSDSEDEKDHDRSRRRRRSSHGYRGHSPDARDPYAAAARYIDTEFFPTKIYVGDLERVSRDELEQAFSRFGPIRQVRMVDGKEYGFITYEDKPSALAAIQSMHGALLGTRRIKVNRAKIPERNRVGFGNVPWTDEDGALAKEEMQSYSASRDISPITKPDPRDICPVPGRRALTTYDDL